MNQMEAIKKATSEMEAVKKNIEIGLKLIEELDKKIERWETITDYVNYSVSTFGRVRNDVTGRILKPDIDKGGYQRLTLYSNKISSHHFAHRLVAKTFLKNSDNKECVDHIDNNRLNNNVGNLRYATTQENQRN